MPSLFDLLKGESIYICGMTKSLCPGLRIAYMAFPDRFRQALLHGLINMNIKTSSFDAEVITELILSGKAYEIASRKYKWAQKSVRLFDQYFPDAGSEEGPPSYYKWLPIHLQKGPAVVEQELSLLGVRVYHSARFTIAPHPSQEFLRVSLCSAGSAQRLERGFAILRQYLQTNQKETSRSE